jgi:hypothetical protein
MNASSAPWSSTPSLKALFISFWDSEAPNADAAVTTRGYTRPQHVLESANKYLARVKAILQGSPEAPVVKEVAKEGTRAVLADAALLVHLVEMLPLLDFEVWKLWLCVPGSLG